MRIRSFISIAMISIIWGAGATQEAIDNSIRILQDARNGISSSHELTTHLVLLTQNADNLPQELETDEYLPFIPKRVRTVVNRPELLNHYDTDIFRIHYDLSGVNAIDTTDYNKDGVPDYLEYVINAANDTEQKLIDEMGYSLPPPDDIGGEAGGSSHYDIYLLAIGSDYYGYTQPENPAGDNSNSTFNESNAYTSYLVLRNNYDGFPNTEEGNIQVTMAHEFFHAIQFGYDIDDEIWFMEATSTWVEDQAFTDVNDCYFYMPGWFKYPHYSLHEDIGSHSWYGSYIFFQYISENLGGSNLIREFWERSVSFGSNTTHSTYHLIDDVLNNYSLSVKDAMNGMAVANWLMDPAPLVGPYRYAEGEYYNVSPTLFHNIDFSGTEEILLKDSTLHSFGARYIRINTDLPVRVTLNSEDSNDNELILYGLKKDYDGLDWIGEAVSETSINIPSSQNTEFTVLVIVNTSEPGTEKRYTVSIENGDAGQAFLMTSITPEPFITSRYDSCSFNLLIYEDQELEISVIDQFNSRIKTIRNGSFSKGIYSLGWDGRKSTGAFANSGTYFIKAENKVKGEEIFREIILISSPDISISNPYPNPSYGELRFTAIIGSTQFVEVKVVDITGRTVAVLAERYYSPGEVGFSWNGKSMDGRRAPSGIYLIGIEGETENIFQKITLIR